MNLNITLNETEEKTRFEKEILELYKPVRKAIE